MSFHHNVIRASIAIGVLAAGGASLRAVEPSLPIFGALGLTAAEVA